MLPTAWGGAPLSTWLRPVELCLYCSVHVLRWIHQYSITLNCSHSFAITIWALPVAFPGTSRANYNLGCLDVHFILAFDHSSVCKHHAGVLRARLFNSPLHMSCRLSITQRRVSHTCADVTFDVASSITVQAYRCCLELHNREQFRHAPKPL